MFLLRGWTLLSPNANWLGNSFDWFNWPNKERIQYLRNFLVFRGEVQKVFWNTTLFCRQWFRLLSALIFKSFFQKQQSVGNTNVFLWTSSQTLVANMIAAWEKKVASCDRRVKHFPFLQKQTLLGTKKLHASRVHQKLCENPFWSISRFQSAKKLHLYTQRFHLLLYPLLHIT